ncbi:MAG TPA: hypothetical protein VEJ16_05205 [Alphaproteobacteria bacterium]|nr:hypothetical protein [Alphaproteobacteria bacterium]
MSIRELTSNEFSLVSGGAGKGGSEGAPSPTPTPAPSPVYCSPYNGMCVSVDPSWMPENPARGLVKLVVDSWVSFFRNVL